MPRWAILLSILLLVVVPATAFAYLDSGSASLLFQAAAASLFTLLFLLKTYWARVKALFRRSRPAEPTAVEPKPGSGGPPPEQER